MKFVHILLEYVHNKNIIRTSRHHHIAIIFKYHNNNTVDILAYATNLSYHENQMIHAELHALKKLQKYHDTRPQRINMLVIRLANGCLTNSKPCHHCTQRIPLYANKLNYKMNYIFYSLDSSTIEYSRHVINSHQSKYHTNRRLGQWRSTRAAVGQR